MKTRRVVFPGKDQCEIETVELPDSPGPSEVLVRNRLSLISAGTELSMFTRTHRGFVEGNSRYARYPFYPGYAAVGEVLAVGADVVDLPVGARVFHGRKHATHVLVPSSGVIVLGDSLSNERAVFLAFMRIAITAPRLAPVRFGETVLVVGMGMVGNLCAQLYRRAGAGAVIGADLAHARLKTAETCGISQTFDLGEKPLAEWVEGLGANRPQLVIEAVGLPPSIDASLKAVADRGRVVLLGSPRAKMEFDPYYDIHVKGIHLIGAHAGNVDEATRKQDESFLLSLLASGQVQVEPLITHRLPYTDAHAAYVGLRDEKDTYLGVLLEYP